MGGRNKQDYAGLTPHKDNHGRIGRANRRWNEVYAVSVKGTDTYYNSGEMDGDGTFTDPLNAIKTYVLDPNGATRKFDPSGDFTAGFLAIVKNIGTDYAIIFDSTASKQIIGPGQTLISPYDGTTWR